MTAGDFPSHPGDRQRAYKDSSGASVAALLGQPGGPRTWDFSFPRRASEGVERIEIVGADEGSCAQRPPGAAYAERTTVEATGSQAWAYYSAEPGAGRYYYGFCDPRGNAASPGIMFHERTLEIPECTYGTSWERTVAWDDVVDAGLGIPIEVAVEFVSRARVDAFGTLVLPVIGSVPALRVNETNTYATYWKDLGIPLGNQYFHNVYWLVPGLGRAVLVQSKASSSGPPSLNDAPAAVIRVFEGLAPTPASPQPVTNLVAAAIDGGRVRLSWDAAGDGVRYLVVRPSGALGSPWIPVATNEANSLLIDPAASGAPGFFRVGWFR